MTRHLDHKQLLAAREIVAPPLQRACTDRSFNLPVALHAAYFGLFLAFLGVMWAGFGNPALAIPMAVFLFFTAAFYIVPMKWATMEPANPAKAMGFSRLLDQGVDTLTGRCSGGAAVAQVLVLPVLIFAWGIAVAIIAALVR